MAVYKADILDVELNTGNIARSFLCHNIGKDDTKADRFGVRVYRDGVAESLSGCSIQGYMMRPNGTNLAITGSNTGVSGNEAWVDLPQAAYDYEGQFCLALKLIGGGVTGTIRIIDGMINNTFVDDALVPMQSVPTYQEILAVYDQMVAAKNGSVRFDQSQSLTETQKSVARMNIDAASESDVSDLKSAINNTPVINLSVSDVKNTYSETFLDASLILGLAQGAINNTGVGETISFGTQVDYRHYNIAVSEGELYKIVIRQQNQYYYIAFTDSNDVILYLISKGTGGQTIKTEYVTVPSGASKLYVGAKDVSGPATWNVNNKIFSLSLNVIKESDLTPINEEIQQNAKDITITDTKAEAIKGKLYKEIFLESARILNDSNEPGVSVGAITEAEIGQTIVFNSASDFRHYHVNVNEGEFYTLQLRTMQAYWYIVFTDANNVVIDHMLRGDATLTIHQNISVVIPSGVTKLYIAAKDVSGPATWNVNNKIWGNVFGVDAPDVNGLEEEINRVVENNNSDLSLGYIDGNTGEISQNNNRFCTATYFSVKKGDHVRCIDKTLQFSVVEYNSSKVKQRASNYYSPVYRTDQNILTGDYIVQEDGYVRITFAVYNNYSTPIVLSNYDHVINIIHIITDLSVEMAYGRKWITPTSGKRYTVINNSVSLYQQSMEMIDGYLWVFCDNYTASEDGNYIQVFNTDGTLVNTIRTDFGHVNAASYDAKNKNLLFAYYVEGETVRKRFCVYHNPDRTAETMSINDSACTTIFASESDGTSVLNQVATAVWGSNPNEVILADDTFSRDANYFRPKFYKIQLGMGANDLSSGGYGTFVSGKGADEYNGTCKVLVEYNGELLGGVDTKIYFSNFSCVQDMYYDGFLYAGIDTSRSNYVIFDLNDDTGEYKVVGNYFNRIYNNNYSELHLEPEGITMNADGTIVYAGLRNTQTGDSMIIKFTRAI